MRLSGTYLDRLIYYFIPLASVIGIIAWVITSDTKGFIKIIAVLTLVWLAESIYILIKYKSPKRLLAESNQILYGNDAIAFSDIKSIEVVTAKFFRLTHRIIKIELITSETIYAIAKPISVIDYFVGSPTKTEEFIQSVPQFREKLVTNT